MKKLVLISAMLLGIGVVTLAHAATFEMRGYLETLPHALSGTVLQTICGHSITRTITRLCSRQVQTVTGLMKQLGLL